MLYPKIEECVEKAGGNKYTLTIIASKRGKDLAMKSPGIYLDSGRKELTYALKEISDGRVVVNHAGGEPGIIVTGIV